MRPPLRAVVFDIGGVLLDWNPRYLYETLIPDADARDRFLSEICTMEWNASLDAGRAFDDACAELAAQHPEHADLIHAWKRQDEMVAGAMPGTWEIVDDLRDRGTRLYLLTNMPSDVFARRRAAFDVLAAFDGAVVSGDVGVLKPSREIFEILIDRFALEPAETLFIDDVHRNVEAARSLGFQAHHFESAGHLRDELLRDGVLRD